MLPKSTAFLASLGLLAACSGPSKKEKATAQADTPAQTIETPDAQTVKLPAPYETKSTTKRVKVIGWPAGKMPTAPAGFTVTEYAIRSDRLE